MSYSKFLNAAEEYSRQRKNKGLPILHYEKSFENVRDLWISEKRYSELIAFILENWDSGNCDDFIEPLRMVLIKEKEIQNLKKLWKGVIQYRLNKLWSVYQAFKGIEIDIGQLEQIDLSDFHSTRKDFYDIPIRTLAFCRRFTIQGLNDYKSDLQKANDINELDKIDNTIKDVFNLKRPKPKPSTDKRKINESLFWELIEKARINCEYKNDFIENLKGHLESFSPKEIRNFQKLLLNNVSELNTWDNWALAYISRRGCGDDEFDYFKFWVVSKGQRFYNKVLNKEFDKIANEFKDDPQFEEFAYIAEQISEDKTGELMKPIRIERKNISGQKWTESNVENLYPGIAQQFKS